MLNFKPTRLALALAATAAAAPAQGQILSSFNPGEGALVAVGYGNDEVFVNADFNAEIRVYDRAGSLLRSIPRPGASSNDFDLDVADAALTVGGVVVPTGTLLASNGDDSPDTLYALNPADGAVLASVTFGNNQTVGVSYNPADGQLYSMDWNNDVVRVISPNTGAEVTNFPVAPAGSPAFDVFFGDVDIDANGNLQIVTDTEPASRVITLEGAFVEDFNLTGFNNGEDLLLSGIAFDNVRGEAWVSSRNGSVFQIAGFPSLPVPEPATAGLLAVGSLALIGRRRG